MPLKLSQSFSFFGGGNSTSHDEKELGSTKRGQPSLRLELDKEFYRPGNWITATIEISNLTPKGTPLLSDDVLPSFIVDSMVFEIRGVERRDTQWFATPMRLPGFKGKRGESLFLDSTTSSIVSEVIVPHEASKTYLVRVELPRSLPPSFRGTTIRYLYFVKTEVRGRWLSLENGHHPLHAPLVKDLVQLEARQPLQIWGTQRTGMVKTEEDQIDGCVPGTSLNTTTTVDVYWKEKDVDSEWVRVFESVDQSDEGYDSSKDETSSVSSFYPNRGRLDMALRTSLSLQSFSSRSYTEGRHCQAESSNANGAEGFIRGRSYNIKIDDQVLLRFSPKSSDSGYYFGDTIGGVLGFSLEGVQRCLEVFVTLETFETVARQFVHPSRRTSPTITKVQSDFHAVVADLTETSFLFSIPIDGPMSFSTPCVSVQWVLRFEFLTNPRNVDWRRYEHPLLVEGREKGEWVLPITVQAPPPRTPAGSAKDKKVLLSNDLYVRTE
ncbi:immunoglobulin isoform X2 [Wolffia australiana]